MENIAANASNYFRLEVPLKNHNHCTNILLVVILLSAKASMAQTPLADQPVLTTVSVPGNLALALSVEFPTAVSVAHINNTYNNANEYLGYFDPNKCYLYNYSITEADRHFYPTSVTATRQCSSVSKQWSGNFLNWATMQTIDPFRWALTGGYRVVDAAGGGTPGVTIIEKAWASGQGGTGNFPDRGLNAASATSASPMASAFNMRVQGLGNRMRFSVNGNVNDPPTAYNPANAIVAATVYEVSVRVKVCDATIGLESNCVAYGTPPSIVTYKPEGLMQKYATRIRYSAFGYLNDDSITRDGGVLRARQAYIGPMQPVPLLPSIANKAPEWDPATGQILKDPLSACSTPPCPPNDAALTNSTFAPLNTPVTNSGVMNYLNKFGQITPGSYKTYDPVGELYYAAVRYFKNLGNVPEWSNMTTASAAQKTTYIDGFPVITNWDDPILYSCQKNFILGIGDVNTHADKNVPNSTAGTANEPAFPGTLNSDPVQSTTMTNKVGVIEGVGGGSLGTVNNYGGCCNNNSALMAGIAYDSHTRDIRIDDPSPGKENTIGKQTIDTYWLDVLEYSTYKNTNQFYLATKYGGFNVPVGFDSLTATSLPSLTSWHSSGRLSSTGQQLPDNYFIASDPASMVNGLKQAFEAIAAAIEKTTTGAATAQPQVLSTGAAAYSALYKSADWSGDITASNRIFGSSAAPINYWDFSTKLDAQTTGSGWDTGRVMVTWDGTKGVPFRHPTGSPAGSHISALQALALDTPWLPGDDSADFLKYLRGDKTKETATPKYRARTNFVGDIVDSSLTAVGRPIMPFTEYFNPGYKGFKTTWYNRKTVLYVGTNAGILHAINGTPCASTASPGCATVPVSDTDADAGKEVFSYVPSALFSGPSIPASPSDNGLAALGNPAYIHRNFVNSTPLDFDVDLSKTVQGISGAAACKNPVSTDPTYWKTVLIGGLGKGGKSYYALDVTNPLNTAPPSTASVPFTESTMATKVLWEFPRATDIVTYGLATKMGFSFGAPVVVKTVQHGWVAIFTSGYNNTDGIGYFFIVDICDGSLVQAPIATGVGTPTNEAGMAHPTAFVLDAADGTADAAYAGDLLGNVWRLDLRAITGPFSAPIKIATLRDTTGTAQPVTSRPIVELCPKTLDRYVMLGTGRLLDKSDIGSLQKQTYYAFKDGTNIVFDTTITSGTPIVRANLVDISDELISGTTVYTNQRGWLVEVGKGDPNLGWRVIRNSASFFGSVAFAATLPKGTDVCTQSGSGFIYGINFCTGKSTLTSGGSTPTAIARQWLPDPPLDPAYKNVGGTPTISTCTAAGNCPPVSIQQIGGTASRLLNWREIPIAE